VGKRSRTTPRKDFPLQTEKGRGERTPTRGRGKSYRGKFAGRGEGGDNLGKREASLVNTNGGGGGCAEEGVRGGSSARRPRGRLLNLTSQEGKFTFFLVGSARGKSSALGGSRRCNMDSLRGSFLEKAQISAFGRPAG